MTLYLPTLGDGSKVDSVKLHVSYFHARNIFLLSTASFRIGASSADKNMVTHQPALCEWPCISDGIVDSLVVLWWRCSVFCYLMCCCLWGAGLLPSSPRNGHWSHISFIPFYVVGITLIVLCVILCSNSIQ